MNEYHTVRASSRQLKRRCRRAWDLRDRQGWTPVVVPQALEFGVAFHAGMQVIYDPETWAVTTPGQKLLRAMNAFTACCEEQRDRYLLSTSQTRLTWDGRDDYVARVELGRKMLEHYVLEVHPAADQGIRPVKVEQAFEVPILDEHGEPLRCNNSPHCGQVHKPSAVVMQAGRVDAIFERTTGSGGYLLFDWKSVGGDKAIDGTEKNTGRFSREDLVWMHDQLCTYTFALRYRLNLDIRGFVLAEIRKDYPKPPALLKRRRNGGKYSTDKNQSTTYELFRKFIGANDIEGAADGAYDDYLEWLQSREAPIFHKRYSVGKTPAELKEVGLNLAREVREMLRPDVEIYPEPGPFTCPKCIFRQPCELMTRGMEHLPALHASFEKVTDGSQ